MIKNAKRDTRSRLLQAATQAFAEKGFAGTRIQEIVALSGINERMIYHHFGSKDGLYRAVLEDQWLGGARSLEAGLQDLTGDTPITRLRSGFLVLACEILKRPRMMQLALHEAITGWQHLPSADLAMVPVRLRDLFDEAKACGELPAELPFDLLYLGINGAITSVAVFGMRFVDIRGSLEEDGLGRIEQLIDLVLTGARTFGSTNE